MSRLVYLVKGSAILDGPEVQLLNMVSGSLVYMVRPMDGYGTCTEHQHYAAKVTILMVNQSVTQM